MYENDENDEPFVLVAKLKCIVIRDLFAQISKNIRSQKKFFLRIYPEGIKMVFFQIGKETQIEIFFQREMFASYSYPVEGKHIYKFDIREFEYMGIFFENTIYPLVFKFSQSELKTENQHEIIGSQFYEIACEEFDQAMIPDEILENKPNRDDEKYTKLTIQKTKMLSNILHTLGLLKVENMEINLNTQPNIIELIPLGSVGGVKQLKYQIPVKLTEAAQIEGKLKFSVKRFKSGLSLLDKNSQLLIQFYQNFAQLFMISKDKKDIVISIAALANESEE